jgi:hypothetical protein
MRNTDVFIEEIKKFRDPKNYTEPPLDGGLYQYEVKKLNESDLREYLELYYKIFKVWNDYKDIENINSDFKMFVNRDFIKCRPKKEHEQINSILNTLTAPEPPSFSNPYLNYLNDLPYLKSIFLIISVAYFGSSFSGEWNGTGIAFTVLSLLIFISFFPTGYMWYLSFQKDNLTSSEKNKLVYFSTLTAALLIILLNVSPYGGYDSNPLTCYKLANGKTECFSERQYEEWLDRYRN